MKSIFLILLTVATLLVFETVVPDTAEAGTVIGQSRMFNLAPMDLLQAETSEMEPYCQAFNYFFTIQLFFGLFALWLRIVIRVFRM
jgi:hypothetical protein